jgi:cellulose 1,4-beta-cellobiosidase
MYTAAALATLSFLSGVHSQLVGTLTPETHLSLSTSKCTAAGCTTQADKIVIDANWRWLHATANYTNCYTGNTWSSTLCPTSAACTANCALDGAKYSESYGITSTGTGLRLNFVTVSTDATNIGSRTYLMDTDTTYRMFKLKNQEFTFDVDMSKLPCGLNGALYFVAMDADGGMSKYPTNKAGAKYGTGYCDAQCPRDLKYINGVVSFPSSIQNMLQ